MHLKAEIAPLYAIEMYITQPAKAWALAADEDGRAFMYFSRLDAERALVQHGYFGQQPSSTRIRRMRKEEMLKEALVS